MTGIAETAVVPGSKPPASDGQLAAFAYQNLVVSYRPWLDAVQEKDLKVWALERANGWLRAESTRLLCEWRNGSLAGACIWRPLPWDSMQLGVPAAGVELLASQGLQAGGDRYRNLLEMLAGDCTRAGIRHLTARTPAENLELAHSLERAGFQLVDAIQTFGMRLGQALSPGAPSPPGVEIGFLQTWQQEQVVDLAGRVYRFDRFHSDPVLVNETADRLHREWLRNACAGEAADAVIVAHRRHQVLGFVTVRMERELERWCGFRLATIVLVATAPEAQKQGVGRAMTQHVVQWLAQNNLQAVQVGTQLSNIAAARLYENCGFRLVASALTFRKWFGA